MLRALSIGGLYNVRTFHSITSNRHRVMVLGGYGSFGKLLSERLSRDSRLAVVIAGRNLESAQKCAAELQNASPLASVQAQLVDYTAPNFKLELSKGRIQTVVHTCGPFNDQSYQVAQACIESGINYVDLADDRTFVKGIEVLDLAARTKGVVVLSGASTVPAVTGAVIDAHASSFSELQQVEIRMSPGNRSGNGVVHGLATIQSVIAYCGKPFTRFENGGWKTVLGWSEAHKTVFAGLHTPRTVVACNVPDLDIFPARYPKLKTYLFYAGVELPILMFGMRAMFALSRALPFLDLTRYAEFIKTCKDYTKSWGSDEGFLHATMRGTRITDAGEQPHRVDWSLHAGSGDGPQIPITPALVAVQKIAEGRVAAGARPCLDVMSLADFEASLKPYDIVTHLNGLGGYPVGVKQDYPKLFFAFQQGLGDNGFLALPKYMQQFHTVLGRVEGTMKVTRGKGWANVIATLGGLPRAAEAANVGVSTIGPMWHRVFNGKPLDSFWCTRKGLAIEHFGVFSFGFYLRPCVRKGQPGFEHIFRKMWVFGIPVPNWLAVRPDGVSVALPPPKRAIQYGQKSSSNSSSGVQQQQEEVEGGWFVSVHVSHPSFGTLMRYEGNLYPAAEDE